LELFHLGIFNGTNYQQYFNFHHLPNFSIENADPEILTSADAIQNIATSVCVKEQAEFVLNA
jgi:hypothetical protein